MKSLLQGYENDRGWGRKKCNTAQDQPMLLFQTPELRFVNRIRPRSSAFDVIVIRRSNQVHKLGTNETNGQVRENQVRKSHHRL